MKDVVVITIIIIVALPVCSYFTVWWTVAAYHRAKAYVKSMEREMNDDNIMKTDEEKENHA